MMKNGVLMENERIFCMNNGMINSAGGQTSASLVNQMEYMLLQAIMFIKTIISIMVQTIGVGLGEMDDMLLSKVEEVTLYVIEQGKGLKQLKEENSRQTQEIKKLINGAQ